MHVHCHVAWGHVTTLGAFESDRQDRLQNYLESECWQFVVHGPGAVKQMGLVSPGFNLHLWKFHRKLEVPGQLLVQDSRLVRDL